MASHKSAEKKIRQIAKVTDRNRTRKSRIRTFILKVEDAISKKDAKAAAEAFKNAQPELAKGVSKGVFKKNTVARKLSRLSKRIKALAA